MRPPTGQTDDRMTPFHVRLIVLGVLSLLVVTTLVLQMMRLSVAEGASRLARAESRLVRRTFQPTVRGPIVDRDGRPLAVGTHRLGLLRRLRGHHRRMAATAGRTKREAGGRHRLEQSFAVRTGRGRSMPRHPGGRPASTRSGRRRRPRPGWCSRNSRLDSTRSAEASRFEARRSGIDSSSDWPGAVDAPRRRRSSSPGRSRSRRGFTPSPRTSLKAMRTPSRCEKAIASLMDEVAASGGSAENDPPFAVRGVNRRVRGFSKARVVIDRASLPADLRAEGSTVIEVGRDRLHAGRHDAGRGRPRGHRTTSLRTS